MFWGNYRFYTACLCTCVALQAMYFDSSGSRGRRLRQGCAQELSEQRSVSTRERGFQVLSAHNINTPEIADPGAVAPSHLVVAVV